MFCAIHSNCGRNFGLVLDMIKYHVSVTAATVLCRHICVHQNSEYRLLMSIKGDIA